MIKEHYTFQCTFKTSMFYLKSIYSLASPLKNKKCCLGQNLNFRYDLKVFLSILISKKYSNFMGLYIQWPNENQI